MSSVSGFYKSHDGGIFKVLGVGSNQDGERYVIFHPINQVKKFFVNEVQDFLSSFTKDGVEHKKFCKLAKSEIKKEVKKFINKEAQELELSS